MAALTIFKADELDAAIDRLRITLAEQPRALSALERIAASRAGIDHDNALWSSAAVRLADCFGMAPISEAPRDSFSWDGRSVRAATEPAVLIHEVAHFQLASRARRMLPDFGLGAGPESGWAEAADAARIVPDASREQEEQLASLLGILWEVELGQPGILAFQEQNWLEGAGRASTAAFFAAILVRLHRLGVVDDEYRPVQTLSLRLDQSALV